MQKYAAGTKGHLVLLQKIHFCNYFYSSVMYNNKQDFVPPLVVYGIVYLTNMESFLYFF